MLAASVLLLLACATTAAAQSATTLSQVKKIYVEPFGQENGVAKLRDRTIDQLREKGKLEVVASRAQADAIVKGGGSVWQTGYVSTDPRSPSTTRRPVFQGFLSVEILGKNNEPLWSYLVTPSRFRIGDITKDLADRLVEKFLDARKQGEAPPAAWPGEATAKTSLTAAGSTFPAPLYQKWFESFHELRPNIAIDYSPVGSDAGVQRLLNHKVDFATSDVPVSPGSTPQANAGFLHFASVVGAVVPVYNLKGVSRNLNFTPAALAGIYLGKIKKWNNLAIQGSNSGVALPDAAIVVIHRSDGSGTTFAWTDYLSKTDPEWKASIGPGTLVRWPVGTGAEGNEGVAALVRQTPNSIGYVEQAYALRNQLSFGAVRNSAGKFIQADLASVTAAATDAASTMGPDSRASITNAAGKNAYPIATFTWWVIPHDVPAEKRAALHDLLQWMLTSGQKDCSALGYAPLPRDVVNRELQSLDAFK